MSTPEDLKGLYTDELKDLWSANDQMQRVLKENFSPRLNSENVEDCQVRLLKKWMRWESWVKCQRTTS